MSYFLCNYKEVGKNEETHRPVELDSSTVAELRRSERSQVIALYSSTPDFEPPRCDQLPGGRERDRERVR